MRLVFVGILLLAPLLTDAADRQTKHMTSAPRQKTPQAIFKEAFDLLQAGHPSEASERFVYGLELAPHDFNAWKYLGASYEALNEPAKAIDAYQRALKEAPDDSKRAEIISKVTALSFDAGDFYRRHGVTPDPSDIAAARKAGIINLEYPDIEFKIQQTFIGTRREGFHCKPAVDNADASLTSLSISTTEHFSRPQMVVSRSLGGEDRSCWEADRKLSVSHTEPTAAGALLNGDPLPSMSHVTVKGDVKGRRYSYMFNQPNGQRTVCEVQPGVMDPVLGVSEARHCTSTSGAEPGANVYESRLLYFPIVDIGIEPSWGMGPVSGDLSSVGGEASFNLSKNGDYGNVFRIEYHIVRTK
jgi:tetratricopeptide repeat protein